MRGQPVDRRPDRRQRGAQVVRDGGEQRGAGGVGLRRGRAACSAWARSRSCSSTMPDLRRERLEHPAVARRQHATGQREHPLVVDDEDRPGRSRGRAAGSAPSVRQRRPTRSPLLREQRDGLERERLAQPRDERARPCPRPTAPTARPRRGRTPRRAPGTPRSCAGPRGPPRTATPAATSTNTPSARAFSGSAMVSRPVGGVKNQLSSRKPTTALTMAGQSPPTSATSDGEREEEHERRSGRLTTSPSAESRTR